LEDKGTVLNFYLLNVNTKREFTKQAKNKCCLPNYSLMDLRNRPIKIFTYCLFDKYSILTNCPDTEISSIQYRYRQAQNQIALESILIVIHVNRQKYYYNMFTVIL